MKKNPGKYAQWLRPDRLADLTNWAANGCSMSEIAQNMGINERTLYAWQASHKEIAQAIQHGRELSIHEIENSLFEAAKGEWYEESEVIERETMPDGTVHERRRTVRTKKAPSVTAQIFYLKNKAGYRDNPSAPDAQSDAAPTFIFDPEKRQDADQSR